MTTVWGPPIWNAIHILAFLGTPGPLTAVEQQGFVQWFQSLGTVLPCGKCRQHYADYVRKTPPNVQTRESLSRWTVDLHNWVNARLGKPEISWEQASALYRMSSTTPSLASTATTAVWNRGLDWGSSPSKECVFWVLATLLSLGLLGWVSLSQSKPV